MKQPIGINCQNMQIVRAAQYQKQTNKQSNQKVGGRSKWTFLQRRHTDGQEVHKKLLNITNYQRNANQNYNEVSPHTGQNGNRQTSTKESVLMSFPS